MSPTLMAALAAAGFVAGALNATVGSGSLLTLVTLLGVGVPAHPAVVANQVAAPPSFWPAAGKMLKGRDRSHIVPAVAMCLGTVAGSLALVGLAHSFRMLAPGLVLVAAGAVAIQPLLRRTEATVSVSAGATVAVLPIRAPARTAMYIAAMLGCGLYAGLVGAGVGTITLLLISWTSGSSLQDSMPARNVMCLAASLVAAITLIATGPVRWPLVAILWPAMLAGGIVGTRSMGWFKQHDGVFRGLVVAASIVAAGSLMIGG